MTLLTDRHTLIVWKADVDILLLKCLIFLGSKGVISKLEDNEVYMYMQYMRPPPLGNQVLCCMNLSRHFLEFVLFDIYNRNYIIAIVHAMCQKCRHHGNTEYSQLKSCSIQWMHSSEEHLGGSREVSMGVDHNPAPLPLPYIYGNNF